jgi:2-deoxy-D-gluconate 3-dehydrogenase
MILDRFRLDGRVALVTGAGRGLGYAAAAALAEAGADIVAVNRSDTAALGAEVTALGQRFLSIPCDLGAAPVAELERIVARVVAELGRLDIVVNNSGIVRRAAALDLSEDDWDAVVDLNLKALFFLSQAAAKVMVEQGGGKIINIASMLSFQGGIRVPSYAAAKSGVAGLTRALANEWAALGINVNAIAPGYMITDVTAVLRDDPERSRAILERIPSGAWGTPDDLKGAVVFLASDAARYMHGAIVPVDGGWLAR